MTGQVLRQELGGGFAAILPGILNNYPGWPGKAASFPSHSLGEGAGPSHGEAQHMRHNKSDLMARLQLMQARNAALQVPLSLPGTVAICITSWKFLYVVSPGM